MQVKPRTGFLSQEEIARIHDASMQILSQVGVLFPHDDALAVFRQHGVKVEGTSVYLTERQLLDAIAQAPKQFTIHARNPQRNVLIGNGMSVFAPGYGAPFLVDLDEGKRAPTMEDYGRLARLAHMLPNQDLSGHLMVEPGDVDAGTAHLRMLHANMLHSDKPFIGSAAGELAAQQTMEMASILFGEEVGARPVTLALVNSLSPLGYSTEMLEALLVYARHRQPLVLAALSMAGSTGPITLAGVLVHQNAELLAGIALTQLVSPGTPVVYGSTSTNVDMRSGALAIGGPELSQMIAAHADLCRHYGLPSRSGGSLTDASGPDAQAGYEFDDVAADGRQQRDRFCDACRRHPQQLPGLLLRKAGAGRRDLRDGAPLPPGDDGGRGDAGAGRDRQGGPRRQLFDGNPYAQALPDRVLPAGRL